jgi:uncharacterized YigZ family protein
MAENNDTYLTLANPSEAVYKDKGSNFLAFAYPVKTVEQIKSILEQKRKEFYDARHVCYAYMLGSERIEFRVNDDGEPSGTAGKPILGQINSVRLTDVLIVVIRYFGGTLLGTSGLIQAYKIAAAEAIGAGVIEECIVERMFVISFGYETLNSVMRIIKEYQLTIVSQSQELECSIVISVRLSLVDAVASKFSNLDFVKFEPYEIAIY